VLHFSIIPYTIYGAARLFLAVAGKLSVIFILFYNFFMEICNFMICIASFYSGRLEVGTCT
jgi:hypothetical protein